MLAACLAVAFASAVGSASDVRAQTYPSQDIRLICAFPAGSGADVLVRFFAEKLKPLVNQTVIVENKVGAGGHIATEFVGRSKPDGHTIYVFAGTGVAAMAAMFKNPPLDVAKSFQIAATINRQPFMLVVDAKSPYQNVKELTEAMLKKGDQASYASAAPPGTIMGEIYKQKTGVKAVEVNYKTAPDSLNELTSGKLDYGMHDPVFSLAQQREGRLRILAVSTGERLAASAELPAMKESGVDMDLTIWWAAIVPAGTPKPVVDQINKWFVQIVSTDEVKGFLNKFGGDPFINTPEKGQEMFLKAISDWKEFVKIARLPLM
ncbi:MAG: tripartite tricarboxylate transporter substrate binding protein [Bradyrhizobiaceae bacterium]|nr:tripartite tricarboxylate transporter substrate binding protein [Bradyrhizobiaceae bacterium]